MIGALIGDVVGSRFEFYNIKTKDFKLIDKGCSFTDDSVLTIAVMDWMLNAKDHTDNFEAIKYLQNWAKEYPDAGYGSTFYYWKDEENPKPYNSCGNGAAMRISAVGFLSKSLEEVKAKSKVITSVSHNHIEGIKGAEVAATMVFLAKNGATKEELKKYACEMYPEINEFEYEDLKRNYFHGAEICQTTVPQAIFCFLISKDFEDCLRTTISIGGDSDTLAAISCAIADAYYKEIPNDLVLAVENKLTSKLLEVLFQAERVIDKESNKEAESIDGFLLSKLQDKKLMLSKQIKEEIYDFDNLEKLKKEFLIIKRQLEKCGIKDFNDLL